jgi:hypothetical protein
LVRAVLLILASLPLLVPQGMCLCHFLPSTPDRPVSLQVSEPSIKPSSCCRACKSKPSTSQSVQFRQADATPAPCPHESICRGIADLTLTFPEIPSLVLDVDQPSLTVDFEARLVEVCPSFEVAPIKRSVPIYLACCALLI